MTRIEPPVLSPDATAAFAAGDRVRAVRSTSAPRPDAKPLDIGGLTGRVPGRGMTHPVLRLLFLILVVAFGLIGLLSLAALFAGGPADLFFGVLFGAAGATLLAVLASAADLHVSPKKKMTNHDWGVAINGIDYDYAGAPSAIQFGTNSPHRF